MSKKGILGKMHDDDRELSIHNGEFYPCQGGWIKQQQARSGIYDYHRGDDGNSTMIVLREKPEKTKEDIIDEMRKERGDGT